MKGSQTVLGVLGLVAAAVCALPTAAQGQGLLSSAYIGGTVGRAQAKDFCRNAAFGGAAVACDQKDTSWRILAGYQFDRNFALEGGFHDLGESNIPGSDAHARAWELVGIGALPVGLVSFYGKLGAFRGELKGGGGFSRNSEATISLTVGAGVQVEGSKQFGIRLEWQRYPNMGGGRWRADTNVDVWSVGTILRFQ